MTTDNQMIEDFGVETSETSIDISCQELVQEALTKITDSWHNLQSAKSFFEHCVLQLPEIEQKVISDKSGYDSTKIVDFDEASISATVERLDREKVKEMKGEMENIFVSLMEQEPLNMKILEGFTAQQKAELNSAMDELSERGDAIYREQKKLTEIQKSIAIEGGLLLLAFILGLPGGLLTIAVALIAVFAWRSGS